MVSKHITRDFSTHKKSVIRPYDEYVKVEIMSFKHEYTRFYIPEHYDFKNNTNALKTIWRPYTCFRSKDKVNDMGFKINYNAKVEGAYRVDVLYEQCSYLHKNSDGTVDKKHNSSKNLLGHLKIEHGKQVITDEDVRFDGVDHQIKRKTFFVRFPKGSQMIYIDVPFNCLFMGAIVRKRLTYIGDNAYGDEINSEYGNISLHKASVSKSNMMKPSEFQCEIAYDDMLETNTSPSGFYIDYMDEVNFYVKDDDRDVQRVFGGYITSILPNGNRTMLTIHAVDRLGSGQNKYVLDQMMMRGGTKDTATDEYDVGMSRNFESYPQALKYLCNCYETTLKSNITKDYTVDGEKYHKGFNISFGSSKQIKKVDAKYGEAKIEKNFVMLRNASDGTVQQTWDLYSAKKHSKTPIDISDFNYMHITYGMGSPKREIKTKITEKVDNSDSVAGVQKFNKCGQSADKKYVMFIGQRSVGDSASKYPYQNIYKRIYENKCPYCGKNTLVFDDGRVNGCVDTNGHTGNKTDVPEGEITCRSCDMDFCGVIGREKINGSSRRITPVTDVIPSSREERNKLIRGEMEAVPNTGEKISSDDIFKAITNLAFKYKYRLGTSSSWSAMQKSGNGDCWAFSELIFNQLKKYGVTCKIVQYATQYASNHRSVQYMNSNNKWADFPYREYGWNTHYNNMLNNTGGSWHGSTVQMYKGSNIGSVKVGSSSSSQSQTTEVTTIKGYDTQNPFQGYLRLTYSLHNSFNAKKYEVHIKFTQDATYNRSINTGLPLYWINNTIKRTTLKLDGNKGLIDFLRNHHGENAKIYLQSIEMIAPKLEVKSKTVDSNVKKDEDGTWYKMDKSTQDFASCKLNLYAISFNDNKDVEPSELNSCGKTVNSVMEDIIKESGYYVDMKYGLHRKDDTIHFRVNNQTSEQYTATEGDDNNILAWNNISYAPLNQMFNNSIQVFKKDDGLYYFVEAKFSPSILKYGCQSTLSTSNDKIAVDEAYFNARQSDKLNTAQVYTYTITVPNYPYLRLGDLVKVIADARKLNSVKDVQSIKITFDKSKMPRIQTELGLGELAPDLQLKQNIRQMRKEAKKETTSFSKTAIPIIEEGAYKWDSDYIVR